MIVTTSLEKKIGGWIVCFGLLEGISHCPIQDVSKKKKDFHGRIREGLLSGSKTIEVEGNRGHMLEVPFQILIEYSLALYQAKSWGCCYFKVM